MSGRGYLQFQGTTRDKKTGEFYRWTRGAEETTATMAAAARIVQDPSFANVTIWFVPENCRDESRWIKLWPRPDVIT